ncbi:hypothetical protein FRB95_007438 [Tulasnella sp. JGI-2019a]|nr:hypothetical protein FRB95_007438 [Tulasnella sp. JGI-2019a]
MQVQDIGASTPVWTPKRSVKECNDIITKTSGSPFEIDTITIDGRLQKAFKHTPASLRDFWLHHATRNARKEYMVFEKERYTYGQTLALSSKAASVLYSAYGVRKGDRVGLVMRNYPEYLVTYWACQLLGAVAVLVNAWLPVRGAPGQRGPLTHCITLTDCKVLVLDAERAESLESWIAKGTSQTGVSGVIVVRPQDAKSPAKARAGWKGMKSWDAVISAHSGPTDLWKKEPNAKLDDNSVIFFTSGTTGLPKGVPSTNRHNLTATLNIMAVHAFRALREGETPAPADPNAPQKASLTAGPFFHVNGALASVGVGTYLGSRLVMIRKWDKELVAQLIREEGIEGMVGVPFMTLDVANSSLQEYAKQLPAFGFSFGGSPASPAMVKDIMKKFPNAMMSQGYGLTESNALVTGISGGDYITKPASTGLAAPTTEMIIVNEETLKVMKPGELGEIWLRGSGIMKGYWKNEEATAKALTRDGWLRTGDIGIIDEEGFLYIKDRSKDLIIRGGENIDSTTVENAVYGDNRVLECAAIAVPDARYGELVAVVFMAKQGFKGRIKEAEVIAEAKKHLPSFAVPVMALEIGDMVRNAVGKVLKKDMKPMVAAEWERKSKAKATAKL